MIRINEDEFQEMLFFELQNNQEYLERAHAFHESLQQMNLEKIEETTGCMISSISEIFFIKGIKTGIDFILTKEISIK